MALPHCRRAKGLRKSAQVLADPEVRSPPDFSPCLSKVNKPLGKSFYSSWSMDLNRHWHWLQSYAAAALVRVDLLLSWAESTLMPPRCLQDCSQFIQSGLCRAMSCSLDL